MYFRPEQHGAEMLGPLSELLNASVDDHCGPVAALCLEALYYVCESEVGLYNFFLFCSKGCLLVY